MLSRIADGLNVLSCTFVTGKTPSCRGRFCSCNVDMSEPFVKLGRTDRYRVVFVTMYGDVTR
jgi:hypothetical protein